MFAALSVWIETVAFLVHYLASLVTYCIADSVLNVVTSAVVSCSHHFIFIAAILVGSLAEAGLLYSQLSSRSHGSGDITVSSIHYAVIPHGILHFIVAIIMSSLHCTRFLYLQLPV